MLSFAPGALALDLETYSIPELARQLSDPSQGALDPYCGAVSLVTLHDGNKATVIDWYLLKQAGADPKHLKSILQAAKYVVAANAKFEAKWLEHHLGITLDTWRCVQVASQILANCTGSKFGRMRGHSLKALCRDFFGVRLEGKGTLQIEDWSVRPNGTVESIAWWNDKLHYAVGDVQYLLPLHDFFESVLCTPIPQGGLGQAKVFELEMNLIPVVAKMELNGLPVSRPLLDRLQAELEADSPLGNYLNALGVEVASSLGVPGIPAMLSDEKVLSPKGRTLLNNPVQLKTVLQSFFKFKNLDSVQKALLERVVELMEYYQSQKDEIDPDAVYASEEEQEYFQELEELCEEDLEHKLPLLKKLLQYKQLEKLRSMDLRKYIHPQTGCIHGSLNQCYAATGRSSANSPNVQQIAGRTTVKIQVSSKHPFWKHDKLDSYLAATPRHAFVAPPGYSIISADYKSQELLIAAVLSGDELMLRTFKEPGVKTIQLDGQEITYKNPYSDLHLLTCKDCCYPQLFENQPEHLWDTLARNRSLTGNGKEPRATAKTVNFGLIYLATPGTLAKQVYAREQTATEWVKKHQEVFPGFWQFAHRQAALSEVRGWSCNLGTNRMRWVAEDNAKGQGSSAGRSGLNHMIQSTGADIAKLAMIRLHKRFAGTEVKLITLVHDELVFVAPGECELVSYKTNPKTGIGDWKWKPSPQVEETCSIISSIMCDAESELLGGHPGFVDVNAAPYWKH